MTWTGYGAAAHEALRRVVADAEGDDPLAPVTVLVPTNLAGVLARRALAGGVHGRPPCPTRITAAFEVSGRPP